MEGHKACAAAMVVLAAVAGVGCGGDAGAGASTCDSLVASTKPGACRDGGRLYVFSGPRGSALLPDLRVRFRRWQSIDIFESGGRRLEAEGRYVVVSVAVTNLTDRPGVLGRPHRRTRLVFEGRTYHEAARALAGPGRSVGFNRPIPAGATREGAFVYDMPASVADTLPNGRGAIEVAGFSEPEVDRARALAVVRLGDKSLVEPSAEVGTP
jgi:hypothetical protein